MHPKIGIYVSSKLHPEPSLTLNGSPIPVVEETKFLEVIFDRKLSFISHTRHLKQKCTKALNLLRVIAHTTWGADQQSLLHYSLQVADSILAGLRLHCLGLCSKILYLQMLDPIQNHAFRLCLGAFRTSPSSSLCVLANELPLYPRRNILRLSSTSQNPAHS